MSKARIVCTTASQDRVVGAPGAEIVEEPLAEVVERLGPSVDRGVVERVDDLVGVRGRSRRAPCTWGRFTAGRAYVAQKYVVP